MRKHFGMYQNGKYSSFISGTFVVVLFVATG